MVYQFIKTLHISIYKKKKLRLGVFENQYAIVELEEWSIASITQAGTSRKGVETLLWITEYILRKALLFITKNLNSATVSERINLYGKRICLTDLLWNIQMQYTLSIAHR